MAKKKTEEGGAGGVPSIRKAAILLVSLSREAAASVMGKLTPTAIEDVTREIATLGEVAEELRQEVIAEFHQLALAKAYFDQGGIEHARELLVRSLPKDEA